MYIIFIVFGGTRMVCNMNYFYGKFILFLKSYHSKIGLSVQPHEMHIKDNEEGIELANYTLYTVI